MMALATPDHAGRKLQAIATRVVASTKKDQLGGHRGVAVPELIHNVIKPTSTRLRNEGHTGRY